MVTAVNELRNLETCPRFMLLPEEIEFIPSVTTTGETSIDEGTVSSRLESLEKSHEIV